MTQPYVVVHYHDGNMRCWVPALREWKAQVKALKERGCRVIDVRTSAGEVLAEYAKCECRD